MTCNRIPIDLDALLDGELAASAARALEEHAAACTACGPVLVRARRIEAALRAQPVPEPSAEFFATALRRAREAPRAAPGRRRVHALAGLGGALAAGLVAVVVMGLWRDAAVTPAGELSIVSMTVSERRTVNLVFAAEMALDEVSLTLELPPGVEIQGYSGRRELGMRTRLAAGNNVLALPLIAVGAGGGPLVAHLTHGDERKTFVVTIDVS